MNRADIEEFFKTLLLGDFEEHQNTAGQIVGGLISLIPILGQAMAGRDITGTLFNINKRGGFKSAAPEQLVNLGFAAFGAIPELGPAFKTVFKPLWKERQLAKGAVHGGMAAIEALLGLGKGGAVTWIRKELIGKWAARTRQMIAATVAAMDLCIGLMEFVATASGWQDWLIPDSVQALAKEMLPGLKKMRGQITEPLTRASNEIREFLEDLLGERAAAVVMAIGGTAIVASAVPATRTRGGHNAAEVHPAGKVPPRQAEVHVKQTPKADAAKGAGPVHSVVQITRKAFTDLASQEKGLVGEHMADYHEAKRLGGGWPHDKLAGAWAPPNVSKLNVDKRPVNLRLIDLPKVNHSGLDAVWQHASQYTVTEAKARESIGAAYGLGKFLVGKGKIPKVTGLNPDHELLHFLLSDSSDKRGAVQPLVQMSEAWVRSRAPGEHLGLSADTAIRANRSARRVLLITFESAGALDHAKALADIHALKPDDQVHPHVEHGITREWEAAAIDAVVRARGEAYRSKQASAGAEQAADRATKPVKSAKPPKSSK